MPPSRPLAPRTVLLGGFVLLSGLFVLAAPAAHSVGGFIAMRSLVLQYSGALALAAMSLATMLALRPAWPEGWLGGLDRMYRLHKYLGIAGLGLGLLHWAWGKAPGAAVALGWLARRGPRAASELPEAPLAYLRAVLHHPAETLGEWTFYAVLILGGLALAKRFPYRAFARSHRLMGLAYLCLVAHALVLLRPELWRTPFGWVMAALMLGGSRAAVLALFGRIGAGRKIATTITAIRPLPGARCLELTLSASGWPGHRAGQFAYLSLGPGEGAHPFTIASAWTPGCLELRFIIKELGDATRDLSTRLAVGQAVRVEGPYGRFVFEDQAARQIWIGAGIGLTPFLARLEQLAAAPGGSGPGIDFFLVLREADEALLERLRGMARAAGVRLHLVCGGSEGRLTGERIRALVPGWDEASAWFCGPASFGAVLRRDFAAMGGVPARAFHRELFALR